MGSKKSKNEKKTPEDKRRKVKKTRKRRRRLVVCFILFLIVAGAVMLHARLPRIARNALEKALPVAAEVGDASFSWPGTITIRNLTLQRKSDRTELGTIARVEARCRLSDLLTASLGLRSLEIEDARLRLREGDEELFKGRKGRVPDHPIQVKGLSVQIQRGRNDAKPWLAFSDVALVLQPQASGCMSIEGSGSSSVMGRFHLNGVLGGSVLDSRFQVSFPRVPLGTEARGLLPPEVAKELVKLKPAGGATLTAELLVPRDERKGASGFDLTWRMALKDVSFKLPEFSDRVTDVNATIEGSTKGFTVTDATANYQSTLLSCRAYSLPARDSLGLRVSAHVKDIRPSDDVLNVMPPKVRAAVEQLHVTDGRIDLDLELRFPTLKRRPDGKPSKPDFVRANVSLRDCSATPEWFPYPLNRIAGKLSVGLDELVITSPLVGWHGAGSIKMTGTIGVSKERAYSEIVVAARDLAVDPELERAIGAMGENTIKVWRRYALKGGTLDADVNVRGSLKRGAERDWAVRLSFDGCSGSYEGFPYALTGLAGVVDIRPTRVLIKNLTGWHGDTTVRISGWVDTKGERDAMRLQVSGANVTLGDDLAAALPPEQRKAWDRFRPTGAADIDVVLSTPTKQGIWADVRLSAALKRCSSRVFVSGKWVPLTDVTGRFESFGDVVRLTGLKMKCLDGHAAVNATIVQADGLTKLQGELSGEEFSAVKLMRLLSKGAEQEGSLLRPAGKVSIGKLSFDIIQRPGQKADIQYRCAGGLRDARIAIPTARVPGGSEGGLALSEISGRFNVENERGRAAMGSFKLDQVRLLHGTMRNVVGRIRKTGPIFVLEDVRGEMYGGRVEASFKGAADLLFFSARARVIGMDVARLSRETGLSNERVWGDLEGAVQLNGERIRQGGEDPVWRLSGSGSFQVDRANLGRTPLVKSVLSYKSFLLGAEPIITGAKLGFEIDSTRLKLHKIALTGESGGTRGVGTIDYGKDMGVDLYFYRKRKGSLLPSLPVIDLIGQGLNWVVEKVQNQIVVVHVTGTLAEPKISPAVLKEASEQVRRHIIFGVWEQQKEEAAEGKPGQGD